MINPAYIAPFTPLNWSIPAWKDKSLISLLTGSAGGGKSRLAAEKVNGFCLKYPGSTVLMLRKTAEAARKSIVLFMEHTVMGGADKIAVHRKSAGMFEYPNGSMLHYGGMKDDVQREAIRSIGAKGGVDLIWMEEAIQFTENDFNELLARLRGKSAGWRQMLLTTNPGPPTHWIYQRLMLGKQATVWKSAAADNLHNPPEYLTILNLLTGLLRKRLVDGLWVLAEGAIYEEYDPDVHVVDKLPDNPFFFKRYIASVDWGYVNPGCIQVWGIDGDGGMWLLREVYYTGKQIEWWIDKAKSCKQQFPGLADFYCDPSEPAFLDKFVANGLTALEANNEVRDGIDRVKQRFAGRKPNRIYLYRGALDEIDPMLEWEKKPTCLIDELPGYSWAKKPASDDKPLKEEPMKVNDHACDTLRYAVNAVDGESGIYLARL